MTLKLIFLEYSFMNVKNQGDINKSGDFYQVYNL